MRQRNASSVPCSVGENPESMAVVAPRSPSLLGPVMIVNLGASLCEGWLLSATANTVQLKSGSDVESVAVLFAEGGVLWWGVCVVRVCSDAVVCPKDGECAWPLDPHGAGLRAPVLVGYVTRGGMVQRAMREVKRRDKNIMQTGNGSSPRLVSAAE